MAEESLYRLKAFEESVIIPRFRDEINRSGFHTLRCKRYRPPGYDQDNRLVRTRSFDILEKRETLLTG